MSDRAASLSAGQNAVDERRRSASRRAEDARGRSARGGDRSRSAAYTSASTLESRRSAQRSSSRRPACRRSTNCPKPIRRRARAGRGDQAQRRPGDDDGPAPARSHWCGPRGQDRSWTSSSDRRSRCGGRHGIRLPLVLMNSEATRAETLEALSALPRARRRAAADVHADHGPEARGRALEPVSWPPAPALEWCPPGHGDIYGALRRSGGWKRCSRPASATR